MPLSDERHDIAFNARLMADLAARLAAHARGLDEDAGALDMEDVDDELREIQRLAETIQLRASAAMIAAREAKTKELAP